MRMRKSQLIGIAVVVAVASGCGEPAENDDEFCDEPTLIDSSIDDDTTLERDCYVVDGALSIRAELDIEPGAVLMFEDDSGLRTRDDGVLRAEGIEDDEILFTSVAGETNRWYGIGMQRGEIGHVLDHVVIEHSGQGSTTYMGSTPHALNVSTADTVEVTNSTFRDNAGYGVYISDGVDSLDAFHSNTFVDNEESSLRIAARRLGSIGENNTFEDDDDFVEVVSTGIDSDDGDQSWRALDVPYVFDDEINVTGPTVTIEPGAELAFTTNGGLRAEDQGDHDSAIVAEGTEEEPIVFTGTEEQPSAWKGVVIESPNPANSFQHTEFYFGGVENTTFNGSNPTNLLVRSSGNVTVENNGFFDSGGWGLYVEGQVTDADGTPYDTVGAVEDRNEFQDNAEGSVYFSD